MAALYKKNIKLRYSLKPFVLNGTNFNRGSIIIARGDNKHLEGDFDKVVTEAANECQVKLIPTATGLVDNGKDFGSAYSPLKKKRSIAMLCGEGTSSGSVGELWYFFERELNYPVTLLNTGNAESVDLSNYDVLILTSGTYSKLKDTIIDYVKRGGRAIAIENAVSLFAGEKTTSLAKSIETKLRIRLLSEQRISGRVKLSISPIILISEPSGKVAGC